MKKQDDKFILKRDKVRHHVVMTRLGLKNQTYQKIQGQLSNGKYNQPFNDSEVETIRNGVKNVIDVCNDFLNDLDRND